MHPTSPQPEPARPATPPTTTGDHPRLSAAIVCKNNADTIPRTLASLAGLADEIVAVDSGSTDATIDLLESAGARVVRTHWRGHVATKQMALEACAGAWVLAIDSDESVEPDLAAGVRRVVRADASDDTPETYAVNRKVYYRGRPLHHAWQPEWRVRLVRRGSAQWTGLDPHDELRPLRGRPGRLTGTLRHDSIPTFADFLTKQAQHARTMAASLHATGRRGSVLSLLVSPPGAFAKQLILKQAWRDGWAGWLAAASAGAGTLMKHVALIEMGRPPTPPTASAPTGPSRG